MCSRHGQRPQSASSQCRFDESSCRSSRQPAGGLRPFSPRPRPRVSWPGTDWPPRAGCRRSRGATVLQVLVWASASWFLAASQRAITTFRFATIVSRLRGLPLWLSCQSGFPCGSASPLLVVGLVPPCKASTSSCTIEVLISQVEPVPALSRGDRVTPEARLRRAHR